MKITNLSQLKKYLATPEAEITLVWFHRGDHKFLNIPRKVEKLQTNAVKLTGGSWLDLDKASNFSFQEPNTFIVSWTVFQTGTTKETAKVEIMKYTYK